MMSTYKSRQQASSIVSHQKWEEAAACYKNSNSIIEQNGDLMG